MRTFLITGGSGRLGKYLVKVFPNCLAPVHAELDITNEKAIDVYITEHKPNIIIHCAAWVDVRGCESNHKKAWEVNVKGTENIVNAVLTHNENCYFIYPSTACVFRGNRGDYTEEDIPYPKNFYGLTKLLSEQIVKRLKNYLIIRTDFAERVKWRYEGAFIDRYSTSVFADTVAKGIKEVVGKKVMGLIHLTGKRKISHYELAKITTPEVKPIRLRDIDLPLPRDQSLKSIKGWNKLELK